MQDSCERCDDAVWVRHESLQNRFYKIFASEYNNAVDEFLRLQALFKDVCWFNFETKCRTWKRPWHPSLGASIIVLNGHRIRKHWKNGRLVEIGEFPIYYAGVVAEAPSVPPEIMLSEIKQAYDYMKFMEEQVTAAWDWAPGGCKYEKHVRESEGAKVYATLSNARNGQ